MQTDSSDYYTERLLCNYPGVRDSKDKLTHAGIYGVDKSMATLENLYGIEIPFYARVNFTSLITMVDSMGGIDVESEYAFTTNGDGGAVINVQQGTNHFNGKQALAFARERYNVPGGDNQRGKDQMAVIQAMFKKMITPEMLVKAPSLISEVSDSVETNMSMDQIQKLIQSQLNSGGTWTMKSVYGRYGRQPVFYSMPGTALYVMQPDQTSVDNIKALMQTVKDGGQLPE
ncbi:MAG: LCP family protein [Blautia faecis]